MKALLYIIIGLTIISCSSESSVAPETTTIDIPAELAKIEETRQGFQQAIKEKRYEDLRKYTFKGIKSIGPGTEEWKEYRRQREAKSGLFRYDSLIMYPTETVIISDSMAYDFGTSSVYYVDSVGNPVELRDSFLVLLRKDKDGVWKVFREVATGRVDP